MGGFGNSCSERNLGTHSLGTAKSGSLQSLSYTYALSFEEENDCGWLWQFIF